MRERLPFLKGGGTFFRSASVTGDRFVFEGVEPGRYKLEAQSATAIGETPRVMTTRTS